MEFKSDQQKQLFESIQSDLPNFPESIIYNWLLPFAEDLEGPPGPTMYEFKPRTRWAGILRQPIVRWQGVRWSLIEIEPTKIEFSEESWQGMKDMLDGHFGKTPTFLTNMLGEGSKERLLRQLGILMHYGKFHEPPVLLKDRGKCVIVDGTHRMSALSFLLTNPGIVEQLKKPETLYTPLVLEHQFWVGEPDVDGMWT